VSNGCSLWLLSGTCYFDPGHTFTGAGAYGVPAGGQITLYGTITDTNFQMNGTLYGANAVAGMMNAYDGYFGGVTTIASNGVLNVSGCTQCGAVYYTTRIAGALTNAGTVNWLSGDWTSEGGNVVNLAGGLIDIQCDNSYANWSGLDSWFNAGTLRNTAGAGTNALRGMVLNTVGLVDVQSGALQFPNAYSQTGGELNFSLASPSHHARRDEWQAAPRHQPDRRQPHHHVVHQRRPRLHSAIHDQSHATGCLARRHPRCASHWRPE